MNRAERLNARLEKLDRLNEGEYQPYQPACTALRRWYEEHGTGVPLIRIRRSFITGNPAPLSRLIHGRSHALRFALIVLFLAQTGRTGHRHVLHVPLTARQRDDLAWADLVVAGTADGSGSTSRSQKEKRAASARAALERLTRPDVCLLEPPESKRVGRFDVVRLHQDSGPRETGLPLSYRLPRHEERTVAIPLDFFFNGWVFVLEDTEIATYLMYRDLCAAGPNRITAADREKRYGIKTSAWEQHWVLVDSGILHLVPDPSRRTDGTYLEQSEGVAPSPHTFRLLDEGLKQDALMEVWRAVSDRHSTD